MVSLMAHTSCLIRRYLAVQLARRTPEEDEPPVIEVRIATRGAAEAADTAELESVSCWVPVV